jgi:hypothetical protein
MATQYFIQGILDINYPAIDFFSNKIKVLIWWKGYDKSDPTGQTWEPLNTVYEDVKHWLDLFLIKLKLEISRHYTKSSYFKISQIKTPE